MQNIWLLNEYNFLLQTLIILLIVLQFSWKMHMMHWRGRTFFPLINLQINRWEHKPCGYYYHGQLMCIPITLPSIKMSKYIFNSSVWNDTERQLSQINSATSLSHLILMCSHLVSKCFHYVEYSSPALTISVFNISIYSNLFIRWLVLMCIDLVWCGLCCFMLD